MAKRMFPFSAILLACALLRGHPVGIANPTSTLCYANAVMQNLFYLPSIRESVFKSAQRPHFNSLEVRLACAFGRMQDPAAAPADLNVDFYPAYDQAVRDECMELAAYEHDDPYAFFQWMIDQVIPWSNTAKHFAATRETRLCFAGISFASQRTSEPIVPLGSSIGSPSRITLEAFLVAEVETEAHDVVIEKPAYRTIAAQLQAAGARWGMTHTVVHRTRLVATGPILVLAFLPRTFSDFETELEYGATLTVLGRQYHLNGTVIAVPGHFYAHVKTDLFRQSWHRLDDSVVTPASFQDEVMKQEKNVYMLFYVRDDLLDTWKKSSRDTLYSPQIPAVIALVNSELISRFGHLAGSVLSAGSKSDSSSSSSSHSSVEETGSADEPSARDHPRTRQRNPTAKSRKPRASSTRRHRRSARNSHRALHLRDLVVWLGVLVVLCLCLLRLSKGKDRDVVEEEMDDPPLEG